MNNFNNINQSKGGGEETFNIPNNGEVYQASSWDDEQIGDYQTFSNESSYDFDKSETAKGSMELDNKRIELFKQRMINQKRGMKVMDLAKVA